MRNPDEPAAGRFLTPARLLELLLTFGAAWLLIVMAAPLATPGADLGLQQRYGTAGAPMPWDWMRSLLASYASTSVPQDVRAISMLRGAGCWMALMGGAGWLALQLARSGSAWACWLAMSLWVGLAWLLRPFQWPGAVWMGALTVGLGFTLLAALRPSQRKQRFFGPLNAWTACVWPGWLLLAGAGCLVILDFAARGPVLVHGMSAWPPRPGARYFGLNQADGLWLASGLLIFCAACGAAIVRSWIRVCTTLAALWQRPRGAKLLLPLALLFTGALGWLGASAHGAYMGLPGLRGGGQPHISGELLRLGACSAMAWFAYRFGEWGGSVQRAWHGMGRLLVLLLSCTLGLVLSDDKGPLLVLALAMAVLLGIPVLQQAGNWARSGAAQVAAHGGAVLLAAVFAIAALAMWRIALTDWMPRLSVDAAVREVLRESPFEARSPNLAQARWLMDATPSSGFGLGRVPYCGARAHAGQAACTLGSGAPLQMPSDFAFVPLFATWGSMGASALEFGTLLWLFTLPAGMLAAWRSRGPAQPAHRIGLLPIWLVAVFALVAQAQSVVSFGATLGWSSLTGVTLPVTGYGVAALCTMAAVVGLAANPRFGDI